MKKAWSKWKTITEKIGNFQAEIIFSVMYFALITTLGITLQKNRQSFNKSDWTKIEDNLNTIENMKSQ